MRVCISLGSPSFSISVLKTNELEKYLVVARCTEMWLRMHGVPRIFLHSEITAKALRSVPASHKNHLPTRRLAARSRPSVAGRRGSILVANLYGFADVSTKLNSSGILLAADSTGWL